MAWNFSARLNSDDSDQNSGDSDKKSANSAESSTVHPSFAEKLARVRNSGENRIGHGRFRVDSAELTRNRPISGTMERMTLLTFNFCSKRIADMIFQSLVVLRTQFRHEHLTRWGWEGEGTKPVPCLGHYARGLTFWQEMHKHPTLRQKCNCFFKQ